MISCEKAAIICNKTQYQEASLVESLQLRLHILWCKTCALYVKKNTKLTTLCRQAPLHGLTEAEKEALRKKMTNFQG